MKLPSASCLAIALSLAFPAYGQTNVNAGEDLVASYLSKGQYDLNLLGDVSWNTAFTYASGNTNNLKIAGNGNKITFGPSTGIYFYFSRNNGSLAINDAVVETQTFAGVRDSLFWIGAAGITTNFDFNGTTFQNIGPTNFNLYASGNYGPIISQRVNSVTNIDGGAKGVVFKGNHGLADQSGTIGISSGTMNFFNNVTFDSNWGANYSGAMAIYSDAAPTVNFNGTTLFNNNHTGHYGGAIDMWGGNGTLVFNGDTRFTNNYTYSIMGVTQDFPNHYTDRSASGGAIHMGFIASGGTTGTSITFNGDAVFDGNFVNDLKTTAYNNAQGGAIGLNQSREAGTHNYNLFMNGHSTFNNNYVYSLNGSGYGGAIFLNAQGGSANIVGEAEFTNNSAKTLGGAIYIRKGSLNINANKGDIVFRGNRQGATFASENRTLDTGNSYTFYKPVEDTGTPNAIYWETSNTFNLDGTQGNAIRFYDPLSLVAGGTLTLNQNGTGETAFYGDNGVSTAYDTDINVNTTVNGGTFTVADGVNYGRTTFGTFDLKTGATLKGENSGTLKVATLNLNNGSDLDVEGGTLMLDSASIALGNAANGVVNLSGYGTMNSSSALKAAYAGTSVNATIGLNGSGNAEELRLEAPISGTAKLVKNGEGTLLLPTVQGYTDGTVVNAGTLVLTENGTLGSGTATVNANGTLQIDSPASGNVSFSNALLGSGLLKVGLASGTNTFDFASSAGTAFAGTVELNDGTFSLSGTNTAALGNSTLRLNAGSMTNVGAGTQAVGNIELNGGLLRFPNLPTGVIQTGVLDLGSGTVQVNADTSAISAKPLLQQDDGNTNQLLIGANTVEGAASNLVLQDLLGSVSGTVQSNVEQGGNTVAVASYAYGLTSVSDSPGNNGLFTSYRLTQLDLQDGQTLSLSGDATTPAGANDMKAKMTGSGNLAIDATDTIILANTNNDYSGNTSVNTGTLQLGTDHALGNTSLLTISSGAGTDINGKTQTVGALGGAGSLNVNSGNLTVSSGGSFSGIISGNAGALTLAGGNLILTGANTFTGTTTQTSGLLQIGNGGTSGTYAGDIAAGGTVAFNRSDSSAYGGVISGNGNLVKSGAGTLTLTGNNTYGGGTQINAGTLAVGNGGTSGSIAGNVTNNGTLTFNRSDDITFGSVIGGSGGLDKFGNGKLTLTAENAYAGATVVNNGTLALQQENAAGTGTMTLADATTLQLGFSDGVFDNALFGTATSTVSVLGNNITLGANNTVFSGTWNVAGSANISRQNNLGNGSVVLGGTLNLNAQAGNYAFNNALSGAGKLNVAMATASDVFSFGNAANNGFTGTLSLGNGSFGLSGANTQVLTNASLQLNAGNVTTVGDGEQAIGNLNLNGGSLAWDGFTTPDESPNGTISTGNLALNSGQIRVDISSAGASNPPAAGGTNLLQQDDGNVMAQLIAAQHLSGNISNIQLADLNGNALAQNQEVGIVENGDTVANASYNFGLSTGTGNDGVYLDYRLSRLDILSGKTLTLSGDATTPDGANDMKAKITGSGNLAITATDRIVIANAGNDYSGNTTVNTGTLELGTDHALGNTSLLAIASGAVTDINGKTQTVGALGGLGSLSVSSGNLTVSNGGNFGGVIEGNTGTVTLAGGNLVLTGANTYTGTTTVSTGSFQVGNGGTTGSYAGDIANDGTVTFNRSDDVAYSGVITGSGSLVKEGAGKLTLTGNSDYAGGTSIDAGILQIGSGGIAGSISGDIDNNAQLVFNRSDDIAYNGVIIGNGSLDKEGSGILTLTGENAYSGGTNVNAGILSLEQENAAGSGAVNLADTTGMKLGFSNGTFDNAVAGGPASTVFVSGSNVTLDADNSGFSGVWDVSGSANITSQNNPGNGSVSLAGDLNLNAQAGNFVFNNALSGAGKLNVAMATANDVFSFGATANNGFTGTLSLGSSRFELSGANTQVLANASLQLNNGNVTTVGDGEQAIGNLNLNGGSLAWDGFTTPEENPNGTISTDNLALNGGQIRVDISAGGESNPPASGGSNLLQQDDGNVSSKLISAGHVTGDISNIQLADLNGNALVEDQMVGVVENGDKVADASYNYGLTTGSGNDGVYLNYGLTQLDILSGKTLTFSGDATTPDGANDMKAKITGSGNLAINATDRIILANTNNDYTGSTTVKSGTLQLGTDHALGNTSLLDIAAGATTDMNGKTQTVGALGGAGSLNVNSGNLTVSNGGDFGGVIEGNAGTVDLTGGTLTLTGENTFTGATTVASGSLQIGNGGTTGSYAGSIANEGSVIFNRSDDIAYGGVVNGNGNLVKDGNGTLTLTGVNAYTGGTEVNSGTLQIGDGGTGGIIIGDIANAGEVVFNRSDDIAFGGVISGNGSMSKEGNGVLTLTADQTYTGTTSVNAGTLAVGNGATSGRIAGDIANAGSVVFNRSDDLAYSGVISGTGQVEQAGNGTLTLTGNNTYDGGTQISDGTLRLTGAGTLGSGTVNIASRGTLLVDSPNGNAYTLNNRLEGDGQLQVAMGSKTDTFDFASSAGSRFTGKMNFDTGSMTLGDANTAALSQATLDLGENATVTMDGDRTIGNLTFGGGQLNTTLKNGTNVDVLTVGYLDVNANDSPAMPGTVNYRGGTLNPEPDRSGNLLLQGDVNANNSIAIVRADSVSSVGTQLELLMDGVAPQDKTAVTTDGFGNDDLRATYGYMAVITDRKADNMTGLFGGYVLKTLESKTNAILDSTTAPNANFGAKLTGVGNFEFQANGNSITLVNAANDYSGQTTAASGTLNMGRNNVFGQTSALNIRSSATVNMNGHTQTVGELNGEAGSMFNLGGGVLTVTAGGNSNGVLSGSGNLHLTGGTLVVANANDNLSAAVDIQSGATARLLTAKGLGSGDIGLAGNLQFSGAQGTLANRLNGAGTVTLSDGSNISFSADNSAFSGSVDIGSGTTLSASAGSQLGTASLANNGNLVLHSDGDWTFTNAMSGSGKLVKEGNGIVRVGSDYAHSGGTEITYGSLVMENASSALSGSGDVRIAEGATLAGYGSIGGSVFNFGTLAVGNGMELSRSATTGTLTIAGGLTNSGAIHLGGADVGNVLRVQGNFAGGGTLMLNTVLGDDTSATDKLVVEGNTSGSTAVLVNNKGGLGADTHNGIQIVQVDGASDGNFYLGSRVVQGAYDYRLYKGSVDNPDDGDWYLRSTRNDPAPVIRPEIGAYLANRDAAQTMFRHTLHDRMGESAFSEGKVASKNAPAFWSYVEAGYGTGRAAGQIDQRRWSNKVQVGGDFYRSAEDVNNWRVGAMAGYGTLRSRSLTEGQAYRADSDLMGYNAGLYATWFADGKAGADGPYLDGWIQHGWFKNKVKGDQLAEQRYNSRAWSGSVEGGWTFNAYSGKDYRFYVQPQVQVIYTRYHGNDVTENNGTVIENGHKDGISTRLGARLFGNGTGAGSRWQPYAELNWLHNQKASTIRIGDDSFDSALPKDVAELKAGFEVVLNKNTNAWAQVRMQKGDDHYKSVGGLAGIRVSW